jgi:putative ABC transport system permease protein
MIKNYVTIAWRALLRNRSLSIINLFGLSVSVAFCLLLFYHIRWEQSFDSFHAKKDRLFRCEMTSFGDQTAPSKKGGLFALLTRDYDTKNQLSFPMVAGPDLQRTFPEVASFTRFEDQRTEFVQAGKNIYKEDQIILADGNFFGNFSFPLLKGDARTALSSPQNVVLSASAAKKYFGDGDAIGKTISLVNDSDRLFRVTGIAADAPTNSSLRYDLVFPVESDRQYQDDLKDGFNRMNDVLIVELKPGVDRAVFEQKMNGWVKSYIKPYMDTVWNKGVPASVRDSYSWHLRPFADCHYNVSTDWGHYTDAKAIYQLLCIVVIIVLLASLNYVLITVSNAAARSQEVGVRKVMGAGRRSIILQSWTETQLTAGIAVVIGLLLSWLGVPLLRSVIGSGVSFADLSWREVLGAALVLAFALGLLAGYYPALLISGLKPVSILKSFSSVRINPRFSRVLVVVQFTCCVVLMSAAFVIDRQMHFIANKDLGFDKDEVLMIHNTSYDRAFIAKARQGLFDFARTQPAVLGWSSMGGTLTGRMSTNGFMLNGKQEWYRQTNVDYTYFDFLKIKFATGRGFSPAFPSDTAKAVRAGVVNESLWTMLGKDARLGVFNKDLHITIVGVVKDYNFASLTKKIEPEEHLLSRGYASEFMFRIKAGQMPAMITAFESEWKKATNNYPFSYSFLDAAISQMYESDMRWQRAMRAASFFAILIASMGLFGLSAITAANRTKEIGIRKILGASVRDLVTMLASGFAAMVGVSIVIAIPLAWWLMNRWLEDFAYRVEIRWWMFAVVGVVALLVALVTMSFQVLRAARANPVEALRSE